MHKETTKRPTKKQVISYLVDTYGYSERDFDLYFGASYIIDDYFEGDDIEKFETYIKQ